MPYRSTGVPLGPLGAFGHQVWPSSLEVWPISLKDSVSLVRQELWRQQEPWHQQHVHVWRRVCDCAVQTVILLTP